MASQHGNMNAERYSRSRPVIALYAHAALMGVGMACACLLLFIFWRFGGMVVPAAFPKPLLWFFFPGGLAWGWFAVEVARTTAARLGYRWGRESRVFQFELRPIQGILFGIVCLVLSSFAIIPLAPGRGLWLTLTCVGMTVFSASMGVRIAESIGVGVCKCI